MLAAWVELAVVQVEVDPAAAVPVNKELDQVVREAALRVVDLEMLAPADAVRPVAIVRAQRRIDHNRSRIFHSTMGGRGWPDEKVEQWKV